MSSQLEVIDAQVVTPHAETVAPMQNEADMNQLMKMAIDKGVDVGILERLVGLSERITERNARGAFFDALAAFQDECPEIKHTKKVGYVSERSGAKVSYSYAPLPDIMRVIRPLLKKHGFSLSWTNEQATGAINVKAALRHIDGHVEYASFPVPLESKAGMSAAQKNGAAFTYGRRQSLVGVLGLVTADQDVDGASSDEGGDELIDDKQLADISALIDEVKADRKKFLKFLEIENLTDLCKAGYAGAVKALEAKRNQ